MNFQKFVKRSTKGIFLAIAIMMIIPLVLWGNYGGGGGREEDDAQAGVLFNRVSVTKGEFYRKLENAMPAYWWREYHRNRMAAYLMQQGMAKPPTQAELSKVAWENMALLEDAKEKGIVAREADVERMILGIHQMFTGGRIPYGHEIMSRIGQQFFMSRKETMESWAADQVVIEKLLELMTDGHFADYGKVYDEVFKDSREVKAWVASFDPRDYERDVKAPRAEEIAKYYENESNKRKFKVPAKILVSYLMVDIEEIKKKISEPTAQEIKEYYEQNKAEFTVPGEHKHEPGQPHREDEKQPEPTLKPLEEVRGEIAPKVKMQKAQLEAEKIIDRVNVEIGATQKDGKFPEDVFDKVAARLKSEGVSLIHDVTGLFDAQNVEGVEEAVGKGSGLAAWGFVAVRQVGDISEKSVTTDKGAMLFRVQKKVDAYDPGLTEPVRKSIARVLGREQLRKRVQQAAMNVSKEINANGMAVARQKHPLEWRATRYFKPENGASTGIEDASLSNAVAQQVSRGNLAVGKSEVLPGARFASSGEKRDASYVVYLEDEVNVAPVSVESDFKRAREELDGQARLAERERYMKQVIDASGVSTMTTPKDAPGTP